MKMIRLLVLLLAMSMMSGCVLTKLISVPMRLGGAVISIVPVVGNHANDVIGETANAVDDIPI